MTPAAATFASHVLDALKSASVQPAYRHREIAGALCVLMSGVTRVYHAIEHVNEMFADAAGLNLQLTPSEKLAIVFHDAVYDPLAKPRHNEYASSALMQAMIGGDNALDQRKPDGAALLEASLTIQHTAYHATAPDNIGLDTFSWRVMDLDMMGFSYERDVFIERTNRLWAEVQAADPTFDLAEFGRRRVAFLKQLQAKATLFYSPEFQHLEDAARTNIRLDIEHLGN